MVRVLVGGVFDLLHYGHLLFLKKAKSFGDHLTVALNQDEFIQAYKGKTPILSLSERIRALILLDMVDKVIINESNEQWMPTILKAKPNIIVTTTEWKKKNFYKQMGVKKEELDRMNIKLKYINHTKEISTTEIIERIYERFSKTKDKK